MRSSYRTNADSIRSKTELALGSWKKTIVEDTMRKSITFICVMMVVTMAVFANGTKESKSATSAKPLVFKYAVTYPPAGAQAVGAKALGKYLEEASGGKIVMKFYPSSQLGDQTALLQATRNGTIQMTECAASYLASFNKMWSVFSLPYTFNSGPDAIKALNSPAVKKVIDKVAAAEGFKIIAWWNMGARSIINAVRPIYKPSDLHGLKIRVMGDPILAKAMDAMGGIGVPMDWGEVYTAVQQKTINGLENSPPVLTANKFQEVAKYFSLTQQFIIPDPQIISLKVYDSLPPDLQKAVVKAGQESQQQFNSEMSQAVQKSIDIMKAGGVHVNSVDMAAFRTAVKPMVDAFLKSASPTTRQLYADFVAAR